jgi:hypothetical protein
MSLSTPELLFIPTPCAIHEPLKLPRAQNVGSAFNIAMGRQSIFRSKTLTSQHRMILQILSHTRQARNNLYIQNLKLLL